MVGVALAALGCDATPLAGKSCPCAAGYTCCDAEQVCLPAGDICAGAFVWPPAIAAATPLPLDATVFAMSQYPVGMADPQVLDLAPDMVVRGWSTWDADVLLSPDGYDRAYLDACHQANIRFIGGANLAALFQDQFPAQVAGQAGEQGDFMDFVTRDARGDLVSHGDIYPNLYWATLANPKVRARAVEIGQMQIDLGVDGLQLVGLDSDFSGPGYGGDEGFDAYHLADFNAYLLAKYPTERDFAARFSMSPPNVLDRTRPPGDLGGNFDYRKYLQDHGALDDPLAAGNPLAAEWGRAPGGRAATDPQSFVETAGPYVYWRQIADALHAYARGRGRDVFVNANGVYPFVDFQAVGLVDNSLDRPDGALARYVPVTSDGHLDGAVVLAPAFAGIKTRAQALSPGAPIVLYLDGDWTQYDGLTPGELQDYWRIYGAEAAASGLFFAYQLFHAADPGHHTALRSGAHAAVQEPGGLCAGPSRSLSRRGGVRRIGRPAAQHRGDAGRPAGRG